MGFSIWVEMVWLPLFASCTVVPYRGEGVGVRVGVEVYEMDSLAVFGESVGVSGSVDWEPR